MNSFPGKTESPEMKSAKKDSVFPATILPVRKTIAPLTVLLGVVFVAFCGILIFVYVATKRANPVMLDQQGRPLSESSGSSKAGAQ